MNSSEKERFPATAKWIESQDKRTLIKDFLEFAHLNGADLTKESRICRKWLHSRHSRLGRRK